MLSIPKFRTAAAAAALVLGLAGTGFTATITQSATPLVAVANPLADLSTGTIYQNITLPGNPNGDSLSPWADPAGGAPDGSVYSSVHGTATYLFGAAMSYFDLVWGSPDQYNNLYFYSGNTLVDQVNGGQISPCCGGNIANSFIHIVTNGTFDSVVFGSDGVPAFEYANIAATVPVPAAGLLLLGAVGGLAALRRRRATA